MKAAFWPVRIGSVLLAVAGAFAIQALAFHVNSFLGLLILSGALYVTLAVSLNLVNGITGQFSIGHAAFYLVGAYASGYLTIHYYTKFHFSPFVWTILMVPVGAFFAALAGLLVGLPSLRLRGDYLAIVTLGFGEIIRIVVQNIEPLGKATGLQVVPEGLPTSPLGQNLQLVSIGWMLAFATIAICRNVLQHVQGLAFLSIREDEVAANAMGVNTTRVKVTAFVLASALAGAAGAVLAPFTAFITPSLFDMNLSVLILTMVVLGGTGSISGSVIAALFLFILPEKMRDLHQLGMPTILGIMIGVFALVGALRYITEHVHKDKQTKLGYGLGAVVASFVLMFIIAKITGLVPVIAAKMVDPSPLRFVLNAFTLIMLMLLRPQGLFGHREISLHKLFGTGSPTGAVE